MIKEQQIKSDKDAKNILEAVWSYFERREQEFYRKRDKYMELKDGTRALIDEL